MPEPSAAVKNLPIRWQLKYRVDRSAQICRLGAKLARKATRLPRHAYQHAQRRSLPERLRRSPMIPFRPAPCRNLERSNIYPMTRVESRPALFGSPGYFPHTEWQDKTLPAAHVATTGPVYLTNMGRVLGSRGQCLTASWHRPPFLRKHRVAMNLRGVEAYRGGPVGELPVCNDIWMLQAQNSHIHGHFLIEILPRLFLARQAGMGPEDLVYFHAAHVNHAEALQLLGVEENRVIDAERHPVVSARRARIPVHTHYMGLVNAELVRETVRFVKEQLPPLDDPESPSKIHLSRERMPNKHVMNDREVDSILADAGFEKVYPELLTFTEQVRLFHNAKAVVGIHCSGILNTMFCQPDSAVIDFSAANIDNRLHDVLSTLGIRHATVQSPAGSMVQYKRDRSLHVDGQALRQALRYCDLNGASTP